MKDLIQEWASPGYAAFASCVIAMLSLLVAVVALLYGNRLGRRIVAIEEQRDKERQLQQQRARLVASVCQADRSSYHLVIHNAGESAATNIRMQLDGAEPSTHPTFPDQTLATVLGPSASKGYFLAPSMSHSLPKSIRLQWCDDSGEDGYFESHL